MIRHTNSFIISMIIHMLLVAVLFLSYKYISPKFNEKKEEMVCVNLSCMLEQEHKEKKFKAKPKPVEKNSVKKTQPKKLKKKIAPVKKKIFVKEAPKEVLEKEIVEVIIESTPKIKPKSHILVTPAKSEVIIEERKVLTAQEKYVDENIAKIAQLLQENLYYPRRARKRGVQGEVLVSFKLSINAEVSDIEILSSKSEILSRGAFRTISELSYKFPKPKENLTLNVPILYKLN